jgi:predicted Zn-dependent peptidase
VAEIQKVIDEELEKLRRAAPEAREVERVRNQIEAAFYRSLERVGGFGGKANQLNGYYFAGAGPDYFAEDLARYTTVAPSDVQAAVLRWLPPDRRVELVVEPEARK